MNYGNIKYYDVANGLGIRVSLFVSGCRNHCKNCFNPETWDFNFGKPFDEAAQNSIIEGLKPEHIKGFTLLGGDPFEPENAVALLPFVQKLRGLYPDKSFWCYSGYTYEQLTKGEKGDKEVNIALLKCFDVLVDGRFVDELKNLNLKFRGSENQRIILIQPTLCADELVLWDEITVV